MSGILLMTHISPEWLAGFFDGEGCINITVAGKHRRCILRLYIVNTDYAVLSRIQQQYGGLLSQRKHKKYPKWKPSCAVCWTNQQAADLLKQIGPYLLLKKRQLELALEFLDLRDDPERFECSSIPGVPRASKTFRRRITQEMLAKETQIKQRMHDLNRKGIASNASS